MTISIGADHAGFVFKKPIKDYLEKIGIKVIDEGTYNPDPADYPDYALAVSKRVVKGEANLGILICGTGIGMSIAANKVKGIRAALIETEFTAESARTHNHANVITFGTRVNTIEEVLNFIDIFLKASESEAERHTNRVDKIKKIEDQTWEK